MPDVLTDATLEPAKRLRVQLAATAAWREWMDSNDADVCQAAVYCHEMTPNGNGTPSDRTDHDKPWAFVSEEDGAISDYGYQNRMSLRVEIREVVPVNYDRTPGEQGEDVADVEDAAERFQKLVKRVFRDLASDAHMAGGALPVLRVRPEVPYARNARENGGLDFMQAVYTVDTGWGG